MDPTLILEISALIFSSGSTSESLIALIVRKPDDAPTGIVIIFSSEFVAFVIE